VIRQQHAWRLPVANLSMPAASVWAVKRLLMMRKCECVRNCCCIQVVLLGCGMDTRPFRLGWPRGTLLFLLAPGEVHAAAEQALGGAGAAVPSGCLLRRVPIDLEVRGGLPRTLTCVCEAHAPRKFVVLEFSSAIGCRATWVISGWHSRRLGTGGTACPSGDCRCLCMLQHWVHPAHPAALSVSRLHRSRPV
jgi:Leucine carboxyl methyltransferase